MENMNQLKDLLKHEINDLYSAEEQIIAALPAMIEKARDRQLKKALQDHLKVTEMQKQRLDEVKAKLDEGNNGRGFLKGLFGAKKCKGMQGLIAEGEKVMSEEMDPDVMDAAIIGAAQKIEHYEISAYGTVRAYAEELQIPDVEKLLKETLDEEYKADDLLTTLATGRLNKEAMPRSSQRKSTAGNSNEQKTTQRRSAKKSGAKKTAKKTAKKKSGSSRKQATA